MFKKHKKNKDSLVYTKSPSKQKSSSEDPVIDNSYFYKEKINKEIKTWKRLFRKLPCPKTEEFEHLKEIFSLVKSMKEDELTEQKMDKFYFHSAALWKYLLETFLLSPEFHHDGNVVDDFFCEKPGLADETNMEKLKTIIKNPSKKEKLKLFFKMHPYVEHFVIIDEYVRAELPKSDCEEDVIKLINDYQPILNQYYAIHTLLVLREIVKSILGRPDFDHEFCNSIERIKSIRGIKEIDNIEDGFLTLSLFISHDVSYALRNSSGFRRLNWNAFDGLYRCLSEKSGDISTEQLYSVAVELENHLDDLTLHQMEIFSEKNIRTIDLTYIAEINSLENITPAFQIITDYLEILSKIQKDSEVARLAILRAMTAVGEAIYSISPLLPEDHAKKLKLLTDIRDHIVHSATLDSYNYLTELAGFSNLDNDSLFARGLIELKNLEHFFKDLKKKFDKKCRDFPNIPSLEYLTLLEKEFSKARRVDDRDERISIPQRIKLLGSLPPGDTIENSNIKRIKNFIYGREKLDRNTFGKLCHLPNAKAKKMHERIVEFKKIKALKEAVLEKNLDFNKVRLNVKGEDKELLEKIKEEKDMNALMNLLDRHQEAIGMNDSILITFIDSIKAINVSNYKDLLEKIFSDKILEVKKGEFEKSVRVIFGDNNDCQNLWIMSYEMLIGEELTLLKRYQIIHLEHLIENIEKLKQMVGIIFYEQSIGKQRDLVTYIACEMLYGLCLDGFKKIKKHLIGLYDYKDLNLYFFSNNHLVKRVYDLLETAIDFRNDIFHFETIYRGKETVEFSRDSWFSFIQELTYGSDYSKEITALGEHADKVLNINILTYRELQKLRNGLKKDLPGGEILLNNCESEMKSIFRKMQAVFGTDQMMSVIISLSKLIQQKTALKESCQTDNIFLNIFCYLGIRHLEPDTFLILLDAAVNQKIINRKEVENLVCAHRQTVSTRQFNGALEIDAEDLIHNNTYYPKKITVPKEIANKKFGMSTPAYHELIKLKNALEKDPTGNKNSLNTYESKVNDILHGTQIADDTTQIVKKLEYAHQQTIFASKIMDTSEKDTRESMESSLIKDSSSRCTV
jgi:uncharacterized protein with HEPN domain